MLPTNAMTVTIIIMAEEQISPIEVAKIEAPDDDPKSDSKTEIIDTNVDKIEPQASKSDKTEIDANDEIEDKPQKKGWKKVILRFLGSYVGLFVVMALYTTGVAFFFYDKESKLELEDYDAMMVEHQAIADSVTYLSEFLADLHHSPIYTINNCSKMVDDSCYRDLDTEGYFSGCGSGCENSPFCKCLEIFQDQFEESVRGFLLLHFLMA